MASNVPLIDESSDYSDEELAYFAEQRSQSLRRGVESHQEGIYSDIPPGGLTSQAPSDDYDLMAAINAKFYEYTSSDDGSESSMQRRKKGSKIPQAGSGDYTESQRYQQEHYSAAQGEYLSERREMYQEYQTHSPSQRDDKRKHVVQKRGAKNVEEVYRENTATRNENDSQNKASTRDKSPQASQLQGTPPAGKQRPSQMSDYATVGQRIVNRSQQPSSSGADNSYMSSSSAENSQQHSPNPSIGSYSRSDATASAPGERVGADAHDNVICATPTGDAPSNTARTGGAPAQTGYTRRAAEIEARNRAKFMKYSRERPYAPPPPPPSNVPKGGLPPPPRTARGPRELKRRPLMPRMGPQAKRSGPPASDSHMAPPKKGPPRVSKP